MAHFSKVCDFARDLSGASPQPMAFLSLRCSEKGRLPFISQPAFRRWSTVPVFSGTVGTAWRNRRSARAASTAGAANTAGRASRVLGTSGAPRSHFAARSVPVAAVRRLPLFDMGALWPQFSYRRG